jgi:hypothetical protein
MLLSLGMRFTSLAVLAACGCASQRVAPVAACQPLEVRHCASIDASSVGQLPLELTVGSQQVTVAEWTMTDERTNAVIGFAAHVPGEVSFTVHAGGEDFVGRGSRWLHPAGLVGRNLHPIDGITFCETKVTVAQGEKSCAHGPATTLASR